MKVKEIIFRVKSALKEYNADSRVSNKYIYNILKTACSFLINRESNKNRFYLQSELWQSYCAEMIQVNNTSCLDIPTDCKIWRSKEKLPFFIESDMGILYKSVTSVDNSISFSYSTPSTAISKSKLKYNKNKYFWIEAGYLYSFHSFSMLKIIAYFENDLSGDTCSNMEKLFRCPLFLLDSVVKLVLQELSINKQIQDDIVQDKNPNK